MENPLNLISFILYIVLAITAATLIEYFVSTLPPIDHEQRCSRCSSVTSRVSFGYCRSCSRWYRRRFPFLAAVSLVAVLLLATVQSSAANFVIGFVVSTYLAIVTLIDIDYHLIQHKTALFGIILAGFFGAILHKFPSTVVGGAIGIIVMGFFYLLGRVYAAYKNKRQKISGPDALDEALGFGDVSLAAVLGLLLGHALILKALLIGILLAGLYSIAIVALMLLKKDFDDSKTIPYGPFLVLGALLVFFPF